MLNTQRHRCGFTDPYLRSKNSGESCAAESASAFRTPKHARYIPSSKGASCTIYYMSEMLTLTATQPEPAKIMHQMANKMKHDVGRISRSNATPSHTVWSVHQSSQASLEMPHKTHGSPGTNHRSVIPSSSLSSNSSHPGVSQLDARFANDTPSCNPDILSGTSPSGQ